MKHPGKLLFVGIVLVSLFYACCPKVGNSLKPLDGPELSINTKIWPSTTDGLVFPEDKLNLQKTGICMSGGGTRAMVCAIGQLKGFWDIGVLDDVGYLSCVSGGSWASVPFTYYQKGATNDHELLGKIVRPLKSLSVSNMDSFTPGFLGAAANCPLFDVMFDNLGKYAEDDIWIQGVSKCYMDQFGLYDQDNPKYFSYDTSTVADIRRRNPSLKSKHFITVHDTPSDATRPYLVVNSSISGPHKYAPFKNPEDLAVMNYTPLGIGSAVQNKGEYSPEKGSKTYSQPIGGGFIEPFAFGSSAPKSLPTQCPKGNPDELCVNTSTAVKPFPIANASGTSSSAFAAMFTSSGICGRFLSDMAPRMNYWPVSATSLQKEVDFMYGDGGNLENLGAISLLQRKVNNLVVFVNTDTAINTDYDRYTDGLPTKSDVSDDILTLFGIHFDGSQNMNKNQVFDQCDIFDLMSQLIEAKKTGDSIIVRTTHVTTPNSWWGIAGGETVNIVWVYNDLVEAFADALTPKIGKSLKKHNGHPHFTNFPRYAIIDEDLGRLVKLSKPQINLLYQFSAWHVSTNKEIFTSLLFNGQ